MPILVTLMMESVRFSETLVFTRATRRRIPEGGILHRYRRPKDQVSHQNSNDNVNDMTISKYEFAYVYSALCCPVCRDLAVGRFHAPSILQIVQRFKKSKKQQSTNKML
jgi:hypothetical protein